MQNSFCGTQEQIRNETTANFRARGAGGAVGGMQLPPTFLADNVNFSNTGSVRIECFLGLFCRTQVLEN